MLYGRDAECSIIRELLQGARESRSAALVIRGEPGVGKSALLEHAREAAEGMRVLRATGIESEAHLPFAALHQLLRPFLESIETIPEPQADALRAALGLAADGRDDRFLVSLAALSLLAEAAERDPLVCLVDDAHWLDDASADALVFVARRLGAEGIVLLFAAREGEGRRFDAAGLRELRLSGLGAWAAAALLERRAGIALPRDALERVLEATGGNPLALLELPHALSEDQLGGGAASPGPLPVSARVGAAFLSRVHGLPEETQTLLLVASADDTGELTSVLRAAEKLGVGPAGLDAGEQAGLVRVREAMLEFGHPLVRSAVYQDAPVSRRRAAHAALASVLEGEVHADRRTWHRAAASLGTDPAVAEELEEAAERARRRAAVADASLALERAAGLTTDAAQRARRLAAAAECAWFAGRLDRAQGLLEQARALTVEPLQRADIDLYLGLIEMTDGVPGEACELLLRAAKEVAPLDGARALHLLNFASVAAIYAHDGAASVAIAELARILDVPESEFARLLVRLLIGLGAHFQHDFARAVPHLRAALALEDERDPAAPGERAISLLFAGRAAIFLGDDGAVHRTHRAAAAAARAGGALGFLTQALPPLAQAELWAGRWASASANAQEGLELARQIGQRDLVAHQLALLALIAAHRGEEDECRSLAAEAGALADARRFIIVAEFAHWALALLELGLGHADDAFRRASEISPDGPGFWAGLDRIEAAARAGRRDAADSWLGAYAAWAQSIQAPWAAASVSHCRALLADDQAESERLFRAALDAHQGAARPFERARTELAFGELLRRARRRREAREYLHAALDRFDMLGAELWAERARVELRASGQTARRRHPSTRDELTPQELQIARFVATGLSNREVAAQLWLSPRTVAFHLRNVFRKLGITSRAQLAHVDLESAGGGLTETE